MANLPGHLIAAEDVVQPLSQGAQRLVVGGHRSDGGLELGHEQGRPEPLPGDIAQSQPQSLVGLQVVHEIAADIVGGTGIEPDLPTGQGRVAFGEQGDLNRPPHLQLVPGQKLVLELEHEDQENHEKTDNPEVHAELDVAVEGKGDVPNGEENESGEEHQPPHRRQVEKKALGQPPGHGQPPSYPSHLRQPRPGFLIQVETVEVAQLAPKIPLELALSEITQNRLLETGLRIGIPHGLSHHS